MCLQKEGGMGEETAVEPGLRAAGKAARPKVWRKRDSRQSLACVKALGLGGACESTAADEGHCGWSPGSDREVNGK